MKFKFKIQQYQTDAVERTVEVFEGQPSMDSLAYHACEQLEQDRVIKANNNINYRDPHYILHQN